ncbi:hypothetical protein [Saccharopolyspora sp. SCSIO 74807]|uniref:hypothetical protein n=1 Tax=Saccharopolyspora sp. SCSIO 74807 TaxID=3118084 RepID=UPI0030D5818A
MSSHDIDGFGLIDSSETAADPVPELLPEPPEEQPHDQRDTTGDVHNTGGPTAQETPTGDGLSAHSGGIATDGNGNIIAGAVDQSHGKNDLRGAIAIFTGNSEDATDLARAVVQGRSGRGTQDPEALRKLAEKFVPPVGLLGLAEAGEQETAYQVLRDWRVVLLSAPERDCGQFSAGLRLGRELQQRQDGELVVREELMDPNVLRPDELLVADEPSAVMIDLRGAAAVDLDVVRRGVVDLINKLEKFRSYLILILPPGHENEFEDVLPRRVHRLGKPDSVDVLASYIEGVDVDELVEVTGTADDLRALWPPKVKAVADSVRGADSRGGDLQQALRSALQRESTGLLSELQTKVRTKQLADEHEWLALLIAGAALEGASAHHIARAADQLLSHNDIEVSAEPAPLLRPSPTMRLENLSGERDSWFDARSREFLPRGFGSEVLRYFWLEHPDLREPLLKWLGDLPEKNRDLERGELEQIADHAAELAGESNAKVALVLAASWAKTKVGTETGGARTSTGGTASYRRSVAVRLLATVATDSSLGKDVRSKLWEWSRGKNADLQLLTAQVCGEIGRSFPRNALTRLKHLASTDSPEVRGAVVNAVRQLGSELSVSRFLRYASEWFDDATAARLSVLSDSISEVLEARSENIDPDAARGFWQRALDAMPPDQLQPLVEKWLRAAARTSADQRADMVEPLVQATGSDSYRIAHLERASKFGPLAPDLSALGNDPVAGVLEQLLTRLNEVDPILTQE